MAVAHELNLMTDLAYHHVVHQAVRGEVAGGLKVRQRDALQAQNELRHDYERMFRRVVVDGIEDGSLRRVDPALATRTLLSNLNAVDIWYRRIDDQPPAAVHELASQIVDLLIGGLTA
jgi:hypothetical protein